MYPKVFAMILTAVFVIVFVCGCKSEKDDISYAEDNSLTIATTSETNGSAQDSENMTVLLDGEVASVVTALNGDVSVSEQPLKSAESEKSAENPELEKPGVTSDGEVTEVSSNDGYFGGNW